MRKTTLHRDIFGDFREQHSILDVWRILGCQGTPKVGNNRAPWRDEKHPSLSIYDAGWRFRDHGDDGPSGDSVAFVRRYLDHPSWRETKAWIEDYMGDRNPEVKPPPPPSTNVDANGPADPTGIVWPGELKEGDESTWARFAEDHGLTVEATGSMVKAGNLKFLRVDGIPCYCITDSANVAAEIRKWGGGTWWTDRPQYPLEGVRKRHLIAADRIGEDIGSWLITEGVSDWMSAVNAYLEFRQDGGTREWLVLSMLGAGTRSIDPAILAASKGKEVVIAPDGDRAGRKMGEFWGPRFCDAGAGCSVLELPEDRDLRDLLSSGELSPGELFE